MAIVSNESTEIGDVIRIHTDVPIVGIVSLYSFMDDIINEDGTRYFDKFFRYSIDGGLNYSIWYELTFINISNIVVTRKDQFVIEYRYTRAGTEAGGILAVNSITLSGDFSELSYPIYRRNVFNLFFDINDIGVLGWSVNVLEKLYHRGLIPDYITRQIDEINPLLNDADFTALFNSITHYFAIIVYFSRQFKNISKNNILLSKFIDSLGLAVNNNITEKHLTYLFENYIDEFKSRGTNKIVLKGDEDIPNGELLRLINYLYQNEFLFALLEPSVTGWCIGKSSPMFNSTTGAMNMIKGYEYECFVDQTKIGNYPIIDNNYDLYQHVYIYEVDKYLRIESTSGDNPITGIGPPLFTNLYSGVGIDTPIPEKHRIYIDDNIAYEITLKVRGNDNGQIFFGVMPFLEDGTRVEMNSMIESSDSNYFFENKSIYSKGNFSDPDYPREYFIRGIILGKNFKKSGLTDDNFVLNIGFGQCLKFNIYFNTKYIVPMFYYNNVLGISTVNIVSDFHVRPLSFNFTQGILGKKSILYLLYKNNSIYSKDYIYTFIKQKLISYKNELIDKEIPITYNTLLFDTSLDDFLSIELKGNLDETNTIFWGDGTQTDIIYTGNEESYGHTYSSDIGILNITFLKKNLVSIGIYSNVAAGGSFEDSGDDLISVKFGGLPLLYQDLSKLKSVSNTLYLTDTPNAFGNLSDLKNVNYFVNIKNNSKIKGSIYAFNNVSSIIMLHNLPFVDGYLFISDDRSLNILELIDMPLIILELWHVRRVGDIYLKNCPKITGDISDINSDPSYTYLYQLKLNNLPLITCNSVNFNLSLKRVYITNCNFSDIEIERIVTRLYNNAQTDGVLVITGNSVPNSNTLMMINTMVNDRGWNINHD